MGNLLGRPQHAAGAPGGQRAEGRIDRPRRRRAARLRAMRLGMLTPSSNTVLEPSAAAAMLADLPGASAHFSRFRVVAIHLGAGSRGQFDPEPVAAAAELLADARMDAICWNGTSGARLGLEVDGALCEAVTARTGIRATTAILALVEALRRLDALNVML
jgi:maleate isomerase